MIFQVLLHSLLPIVLAQHVPSPRWAQAVALLADTLYVHGGLSDPSNSYSYSSAPEISELLVLDLSTSFNSSSPPWQLFSPSSSPALAWHTLSAFNPIELFLFGGQPGPNSLTVLTTLNDSAGLFSTHNTSSPFFFLEPPNWANQPMRRIRHSAPFMNGNVWIIGGEQADGSGNAFSEHYSFSPSDSEFVLLPSSSSAPPDIYGHVSLVLPDGRLLVLGGYCASCSELVPMSTAWSLNTTQNPPVWEKLLISNQSLPSPRRDFAAVVLPNGQVIIHGGGDALLQTTYSDGWILDTGQDPMVWTNIAALTQLGERKDHLAAQAGGYVLFCFGYGSSSPASASLSIYDPTTSSMVTSYSAPSPGSTPAITSLPASTQTSLNPKPNSNGDGGTGIASPAGSSGSPPYISGSPPYTSGSPPYSSGSGSGNHTAAIVLGTIFAVFGLVAGGLVTIYYSKRRCRGRGPAGRFFPLINNPESPSDEGSMGDTAPEAVRLNGQTIEGATRVGTPGLIQDVIAHLGIDKFNRQPSQPRKDMFADEDIRSFGLAGHSGTVQRQHSGETSVWSLRSMSALVRGVIGREPSGSGADQRDYERERLDREEVKEGLIRPGSFHSEYSSHLSHQRDGSFWSYTDPFEDGSLDNEYDGLNLRPGVPEKDADYDHPIPVSDEMSMSTTLGPEDFVWPFSAYSRMLTPLREASHTCLLNPSPSSPSPRESSHGQISMDCVEKTTLSPPSISISPTCYSPASRLSDPHPIVSAPRHSPISGSTLSYSPSISRPDSWWSRLTKSPLLDRRTSITSAKPLDFRDPTPAPPLGKLEEAKQSSATSMSSDETRADTPAGHGRTVSSAHSGRTANTAAAEQLGGKYDVVQRLPSDRSSLGRVPSLGSAEITEQKMYAVNDARSELSLSSYSPHVDPPHSTSSPASPAMTMDTEVPSTPLLSSQSESNSTPQKKGTLVSSRVRAYELRLSQELDTADIPPACNTRRREEIPSRTRPTIQYGVAPRASLFIANPDLGHFS